MAALTNAHWNIQDHGDSAEKAAGLVDVRLRDGRTSSIVRNFHGPAMHVVERYSEIDRDHILYEATICDPDSSHHRNSG